MTTEHRVREAVRRAQQVLATLAAEAAQRSLPMTCRPPAPLAPFAYGDVVPLGFLLRALPPGSAGHGAVTHLLRDRRQGLLWAYHRDTLVTCTDSALVLHGFRDAAGVAALDRFGDDRGRYHPQLSADTARPGVMKRTSYNRHWCQADYATTALVHALRSEAGLPARADTECYLLAEAERRSGLYFANPYLVDWLLARALSATADAAPVRDQLAAEVLGSANEDGSFGRYDVAMSTALAVLALDVLDVPQVQLASAQERLADLLDPDGGCPAGVPFYSSVVVPADRFPPAVLTRLLMGGGQGQFVAVHGEVHAVSLYFDDHRMVSTALATLALSAIGTDGPARAAGERRSRHPRYACGDRLDYVRRYALPPYAG